MTAPTPAQEADERAAVRQRVLADLERQGTTPADHAPAVRSFLACVYAASERHRAAANNLEAAS